MSISIGTSSQMVTPPRFGRTVTYNRITNCTSSIHESPKFINHGHECVQVTVRSKVSRKHICTIGQVCGGLGLRPTWKKPKRDYWYFGLFPNQPATLSPRVESPPVLRERAPNQKSLYLITEVGQYDWHIYPNIEFYSYYRF